MPLRIHLTAEDVARTRLAQEPRAMLELDLALRLLQEPSQPTRFGAWRGRSLRRLAPGARRLFDLVPPTGWSVGFLDRAMADSVEEAAEAIRATPASRVRADMRRWAERRGRPVPGWTRALGNDRELLRELADAVTHVHREAVAPCRDRITALARADRTLRERQAAEGGTHALLSALNPRRIRWRPPVLELTMASGTDGDVHLEGEGLLLVPSVFGAVHPLVDATARPQPYLTYPVGSPDSEPLLPAVATARALATVPDSLAALLGHTRAMVLWTIAEHPGCTTTELARRTGISPASASQHATVLRTAGLTHTARHRNTALHTATPLGLGVLNGGG
ncbi:MarR family transcriptional regulator [Streptomyces sp. 3MP-14]|uniref:MarR family transcriptional regulator n=1 Tax=Streptomyces mimosae TaxID=2586635 RepID=A0A5N6A4X4_9ACTN|nr:MULTISPECIES: MarR family transcriptional regulator [Streptomyces]KAB8162976.1 MarR family transcriptional regulator [Streptomyces mimosae]KAB8179191.1 MarR family transcriptional regulator [Streptomyces sp. 3MP-14]